MKYLYYISEDNISAEFLNSPGKTKIFAIPMEMSSIVFKDGEGPFTSVRNLKRNSRIFKQIAKRSSNLANQILDEKNIIKVKANVFTNHGEEFPKDFISLFDHTIRGQIQNKQVYGIHYFDPSLMRIREKIESENEVGVWVAKIDLFNKNTNQWTQKEQETSFFPEKWSINQLFHEIYYAFKHMSKDETKEFTFLSKTESGVSVKIIIKENQVKSIYPVF
jgi:hypothetical protein